MNTKEFIENNFECQLLDDNSDLWSDIMGSDLLHGWTYDLIRFKIPFNYAQTGFNKSQYRGFIIYGRVIRWDEKKKDLELERLSNRVYDKTNPDWFFRNTIRFWFCSCRSGSRYIFPFKNSVLFKFRSLGACAHINAALLGFGASAETRHLFNVKPSIAMSAEEFPDTTDSPEDAAVKRARIDMNWEDESDDDFDEV